MEVLKGPTSFFLSIKKDISFEISSVFVGERK